MDRNQILAFVAQPCGAMDMADDLPGLTKNTSEREFGRTLLTSLISTTD